MATQADEIIDDTAGADTAANDTGEAEVTNLSDVEALAVEMGWLPEAQYTGAPGKWKPAKDYVLGERDVSRTLKHTVRGMKDQLDRLATANTRQMARALKQQEQEINARWEKAVEDGDHKAAREAQDDLRELESAAEPVNADRQFAQDNPWYGKDDDATAYAVAISQREARKGRSVADQLEAAASGVRKRFPELFEGDAKPQVKPQPGVNAPASRSASVVKRTGYADLPPEARAAGARYCDLFAQRFGGKSEDYQAQFAKDYFENKAA